MVLYSIKAAKRNPSVLRTRGKEGKEEDFEIEVIETLLAKMVANITEMVHIIDPTSMIMVGIKTNKLFPNVSSRQNSF